MKIHKHTFGIGDRFSMQGEAQLRAILRVCKDGIDVVPVWNKSNREHQIVRSLPSDTRAEADLAVKALNYTGEYYVDADHINMNSVKDFLSVSDFFTIDVAEYIGEKPNDKEVDEFVRSCKSMQGELFIPGISTPFKVSEEQIRGVAENFLAAIVEAGNIYRFISKRKRGKGFIIEVSIDEVGSPQTPVELLFILKMIAEQGIPAQTIAPKFSGRFNKGVDYVGDVKEFTREFEEDILVIDYAVKSFGLPQSLKLSIHSGSDKFSIYPAISKVISKYDKGIHVKTAGTSWLEEVIGLALAGGEALEMAKSICKRGLDRKDELCAPYSDVIDIRQRLLPSARDIESWSGNELANSLRHIPEHSDYNPDFRQLIHVAYKVASEYGEKYVDLLKRHSGIIGKCVEENLYDRHLKRLFGAQVLPH